MREGSISTAASQIDAEKAFQKKCEDNGQNEEHGDPCIAEKGNGSGKNIHGALGIDDLERFQRCLRRQGPVQWIGKRGIPACPDRGGQGQHAFFREEAFLVTLSAPVQYKLVTPCFLGTDEPVDFTLRWNPQSRSFQSDPRGNFQRKGVHGWRQRPHC